MHCPRKSVSLPHKGTHRPRVHAYGRSPLYTCALGACTPTRRLRASSPTRRLPGAYLEPSSLLGAPVGSQEPRQGHILGGRHDLDRAHAAELPLCGGGIPACRRARQCAQRAVERAQRAGAGAAHGREERGLEERGRQAPPERLLTRRVPRAPGIFHLLNRIARARPPGSLLARVALRRLLAPAPRGARPERGAPGRREPSDRRGRRGRRCARGREPSERLLTRALPDVALGYRVLAPEPAEGRRIAAKARMGLAAGRASLGRIWGLLAPRACAGRHRALRRLASGGGAPVRCGAPSRLRSLLGRRICSLPLRLDPPPPTCHTVLEGVCGGAPSLLSLFNPNPKNNATNTCRQRAVGLRPPLGGAGGGRVEDRGEPWPALGSAD